MLLADIKAILLSLQILKALLLLFPLATFGVAIWTLVTMWLWRADKRRAEQEWYDLRYRADGKPYPPAGRGFCDNCETPCQKVYYMPSNQRLCPDCYKKFHGS